MSRFSTAVMAAVPFVCLTALGAFSIGCSAGSKDSAQSSDLKPAEQTAAIGPRGEVVNPKAGAPKSGDAKAGTSEAQPAPTDAGATASGHLVSANTKGVAFVPMYHHLGKSKDAMFRAPEDFREDLTRMERLGFRPVTVDEFLAGCPNLAPGTSPVVMTFDDSNADQFQLLPDGSVDPNCFVGIWQDFAKAHPDFPVKATFFVLPDTLFGQPSLRAKKLEMLKGWGCQIANHTMTHPHFRDLTDSQVEAEIGGADAWLVQHGVEANAPLALPFGMSPKNRKLLEGFDYQGKMVEPEAVFLVGANPTKMPGQKGFDPLRIPRIQANKGPLTLDDWLKKVEVGKVHLYVAGGGSGTASASTPAKLKS